MSVGLFLGAGASMAYGYSTTVQMKERVLKSLPQNSSFNNQFARMIINHNNSLDIEYVLDLLYRLDKFSDKLINPDDEYVQEFMNNFVLKLGNTYHQSNFTNFKKTIHDLTIHMENIILNEYRWDEGRLGKVNAIFGNIYEKLKNKNLHIFTTNYDRVVEKYCEHNDIRCIDGFKVTSFGKNIFTGNFKSIDNLKHIRLYKLHGSIHYIKQNNEIISIDTDEQRNNRSDHLFIYPILAPKKKEKELPYKTIIKKFKNFMNDAGNILIVIGFSFRDFRTDFDKFIENNGKIIIISKSKFHTASVKALHSKFMADDKGVIIEHDLSQNKIDPSIQVYHYPLHISLNNIDKVMNNVVQLVNQLEKCEKNVSRDNV